MYGLQGKSERIILHDRTEHLAVMPSFLSAVSHICQSLGFPTTLKDGKWRGRGAIARGFMFVAVEVQGYKVFHQLVDWGLLDFILRCSTILSACSAFSGKIPSA